ncbi:MAG: hypothetical protein GEU82_02105 [Luteitalea sp.]|nr:hypothetical protein [Luteitalea sp.]
MEPTRVCDRCGGIVDVIVLPKRKVERRAGDAWAIGACRSCGATFNPAGVLALDPVGTPSSTGK